MQELPALCSKYRNFLNWKHIKLTYQTQGEIYIPSQTQGEIYTPGEIVHSFITEFLWDYEESIDLGTFYDKQWV